MYDLLWGLGLFLMFEGLAYVLAPRLIEQMLAALASVSLEKRRLIGAMIALAGAILLWLVKVIA
jgi:uncharacterized protein YjeT (DUF2065 family)